MLVHEYIKEFNKLANETQFLSSTSEITLKNKLILIQSDITNISSTNGNSYEIFNFYSNLYNILTQTSDLKSPIISSCLDVLITSVNSKNNEIRKIVCDDINYLPSMIKLLVFIDDDNDKLLKILNLIKALLTFNSDLDEHNTKCLISSLCDQTDSSNEKIVKLSLHVLANLAFHHPNAKHLVTRSVRSVEVAKKIKSSNELIEMKFLVILLGELPPKDFTNLIVISLKNINAGVSSLDVEPIIHSMDLLKHAKDLPIEEFSKMSEFEEITSVFSELNENLSHHTYEPTPEYFDQILDYYTLLIEIDPHLVTFLEQITVAIFSQAELNKSSSALLYLSTYIRLGGTFSNMESSIEPIIEFFIEHADSNSVLYNDQKYAFLKFLKTVCDCKKLENTHYKSLVNFIELTVATIKNYTVDILDEEIIKLVIYCTSTLYSLCKESDLFKDSLDSLLELNILPCAVARAFSMKNEDIANVLFNLSAMDRFPKAKVARLLSSSENHWNRQTFKHNDCKHRLDTSTRFTKYMTEQMHMELTSMIKKVNRKLDSKELELLNASEIMSLYRQANVHLQAHLETANESIDRFSSLCNKVQQENSILSKLNEKHELMNWCLQLDKEKMMKENKNLRGINAQLSKSMTNFQSKIEKEFAKTIQVKKCLDVKTMELEKIKAEKEAMESEKLMFKLAQKENEKRIQELKAEIETEKQARAQEASSSAAEQKKLKEKQLQAEKENIKLQEVIKLSEKELVDKKERISALENELKEAEKIQASIMSIMQKSRRN